MTRNSQNYWLVLPSVQKLLKYTGVRVSRQKHIKIVSMDLILLMSSLH